MKKLIAILISILMLLSFAALAEDSGRTPAEYTFELSGEDKYIENLIFNENVVISGDGSANIFFINCQFNADIINTSDQALRVFLLGSQVNGNCIFRNAVSESTLEAPFPKFMTDSPINVLAEDCFGAIIVMGDFEITLNGESYTLAGSEYFFDSNDPEAGYVPLDGQEANLFWVASWTENGQPQIMHTAEFDASM